MKVVLIDDDEAIRKLARVSLEVTGWIQTAASASGREGLERARAEPPDLILLDVVMPGMDGLSVLAELRSTPELREIPVIFMTANAAPSEVSTYLARGALGVIPKPFNPITLADEIRAILALRE